MLLNYAYLRSFPKVFRTLTGLDVPEFADLIHDILPRWEKTEPQRLSRRDRKRDIGGGPPFELGTLDQLLLTVIWLRCYPTQEVLGFLFGISDTTAGRYIHRMLPLLEKSGRDTMRGPDPGRRHRQGLNDLFNEIPELKAVVIDTFEQRVQRHQNRAECDQNECRLSVGLCYVRPSTRKNACLGQNQDRHSAPIESIACFIRQATSYVLSHLTESVKTYIQRAVSQSTRLKDLIAQTSSDPALASRDKP